MDHPLEIKNQTNYYEHAYKNSMKSDVDIIVGEKVIKAHKDILGIQNLIFQDEFLSQPDLKRIEMVDLDPEAVEIFMKYLYTGKIPDGIINEELLMVAHRYLDPNLKQICRKELSQNLTVKNAMGRFLVFVECKEKNLINETSIFLAKNFNDVKMNYSDFDKVFENEKATDVIFKSFGNCKITILTEDKNPDRKKLIDSLKSSDLTIKVQNEHFLAHKEILSTRNPAFETDISALPKPCDLSSSIDIPDVDPSTFKIFLNYIYTDDVDKQDISKELMKVANKYMDTKLQKICEDYFVSLICEDNAVELLILSIAVMSQNLQDKTSKFIADKYAEMKKRSDFQQVKELPAAVEAVLNQFELRGDSLNHLDNSANEIYKIDSKQKCKDSDTYEHTFTVNMSTGHKDNLLSFFIRNVPFKILKSTSCDKFELFLECIDKNIPFQHSVRSEVKLISSKNKMFDILVEGKLEEYVPKKSIRELISVRVADYIDIKKGLMSDYGDFTVTYRADYILRELAAFGNGLPIPTRPYVLPVLTPIPLRK